MTLPAVQDGVRAFSANPLGRMSIQLSNSAYNMVGAPVLSLLHKPLAYVTPYAQRVDEFGDQTLSRVEARYPAVKKPSPELFKEARDAVYAPVRHVADVYHGAYEQASPSPAASTGAGRGVSATLASGRAAAKTVVLVSAEGAIYAAREALRWGESFQITQSLKAVVDRVEETVKRQNGDASHDRVPEAKSGSA